VDDQRRLPFCLGVVIDSMPSRRRLPTGGNVIVAAMPHRWSLQRSTTQRIYVIHTPFTIPLSDRVLLAQFIDLAPYTRSLMRWLQLRFDFDSTAVRLLIEDN